MQGRRGVRKRGEGQGQREGEGHAEGKRKGRGKGMSKGKRKVKGMAKEEKGEEEGQGKSGDSIQSKSSGSAGADGEMDALGREAGSGRELVKSVFGHISVGKVIAGQSSVKMREGSVCREGFCGCSGDFLDKEPRWEWAHNSRARRGPEGGTGRTPS